MQQTQVTKRVDAILKTDWKAKAEELLERRKSGLEEGQVSSNFSFCDDVFLMDVVVSYLRCEIEVHEIDVV